MSMRVDPANSGHAARRHLFRYIDDARELQRNPIVARFFDERLANASASEELATEAVRSAVLAALDECELRVCAAGNPQEAQRYREIIVSHVLGHQPPDSVAARLNLSRSQFYRERRTICDRIASMLSKKPPARSMPAIVALRPDVVALARAQHMLEAFETQPAILVLDDVGRKSADPMRQIEARCFKSHALIAELAHDRAARELDAASSIVTERSQQLSEAQTAACRLRIELARATLATSAGRGDEAEQLTGHMLAAIERNPSVDESTKELYVDALLFASERACVIGDFSRYRTTVAAAHAFFTAIRHRGIRQKARILYQSALLATDKSASMSFADANRMQAAARDFAERAGLTRAAIESAIALAYNCAFGLGDHQAALRQALPALEMAQCTQNSALIGAICVDVAAIRRNNREFDESLRLLGVATSGKLDAFNTALAYREMSAAYLGLEQHDRAKAYAERACVLAGNLENRRLQASSLRMLAIAHYQSREVDLARECIKESLELVDRFGNRHSAAGTYYASSVITGNREHARQARSLNPRIASFYALA